MNKKHRGEPPYFLGIDNGGTATKAAIYDCKGIEIGVKVKHTNMVMPKPGFTERDMETMWQINREVIKEVLHISDVEPRDIAAVSVTGHGNGLYLVGNHGKLVYNGIISTDQRAENIVKQWQSDGTYDKLHPISMQQLWAGQPLPLLAWFNIHSPEILEKTRWILSCKDYIRFCLTGNAYGEITDMSAMHFMDVQNKEYSKDIFHITDLDQVMSKLPPLIQSTDVAGYITEEVANSTGLHRGTPVIAGCFDIDACALASGLIDKEALNIIMGTWSINQYITAKPVCSKDLFMTSVFVKEGFWLETEGSPTSASNLEWFVQHFMKQESHMAKQMGLSIYEYCNELIEQVDPKELDLYFLPYLYGHNLNKEVKGSFIGLAGHHNEAQLLRSIYEGITYSHKIHIDKLLKYRDLPASLRVCGGASRSKQWLQILADLMQLPVETMEVEELGTLGAAICAAVGIGYYESIDQAVQSMLIPSKNRIIPNTLMADVYAQKYRKFMEITTLLGQLRTGL